MERKFQETYQDLEDMKNNKEKYYIPDMGTDEPIEVTKEIYDAYTFLMNSLEALDKDGLKKANPTKKHKSKDKKDGDGKR